MKFDNREALAYLLFRRFSCSRDVALAAVDEMGEMVPAIKKVTAKRWRSRKRKTRAKAAAEHTTDQPHE